MVAVPVPAPVASPAALIVATFVSDDDQVAVEVTLPVVPSLYVAVAVNCWVAPSAMLGLAGVTAMDDNVAEVVETVSVAVPLTPVTVAVMVVDPAATPVARPAALIVATFVFALTHVAVEVTFFVDPSL